MEVIVVVFVPVVILVSSVGELVLKLGNSVLAEEMNTKAHIFFPGLPLF